MLWHRGLSGARDVYNCSFKLSRSWRSAVLQCIDLEKQKLEYCNEFILASQDNELNRAIEEVRMVGKHVHLTILYKTLHAEINAPQVQYLLPCSTTQTGHIDLDKREFSAVPNRFSVEGTGT
ncbi:MAG: hypothetical protein RIC29_05930 [Rhodospirillaceae bacterium]